MPNTKQEDDTIERAPHYNTRKVEAINFIRHMDFATGNAFKYVWRHGLKDATTLEKGKRNYYIRDALVHRPALMGIDEAAFLTRLVSTVADELEVPEFELLVSLIWAASGDYDMLIARAKQLQLFPVSVERLIIG
ncbi:DUF3310 domain-containing protein [Pseudoalteromonas sp. SWYJZ19]|uniref:DUF3310 domain-containing protein n=1 Tax=Pseudoalteromonas sp. SWYJZ19 TaxID=2792068 RepID=UPI0018CD91A2|nr:DUF3310 domain-containing protein [Pseudoalteromonas sp. SWYJZ19]MBH0050680.1 DUF3310 domain-containing protein [Pseudoalteromonas sp. SWYJZ19]